MYLLPLPSSTLADRAWSDWPSFLGGDGNDASDPDHELQNWSSLIGIITAICGNVLIALALNVQRYAHIRLHRKKLQIRERAKQAMRNAISGPHAEGEIRGYGAADTSNGNPDATLSASRPGDGSAGPYTEDDEHGDSEMSHLAQSFRSDDSRWTEHSGEEEAKVSLTYLRDPYWWLGQVLITVGEMGNFLAYGFAPASIVSPLGVVALVSNCVIAPIFFKEVFRQRDFWGVIIAITGAVTVVLSAKTEETKLGPHEVWDAITTMEFEIYMGVSCALIILLMWLSPRYGSRTILIDLGLVGLFGGYTALSTKGVSSMLSSTLLGAFTTPVTYGLLLVLLTTAIMQVKYLNKALQRFESTQVIPTQFVIFTLSVIIGSAVLYRDFERTTGEQAVKFVGGCLFTFFGVFLITSGRPRNDIEDEPTLSDAEGIEETIGLSHQDPGAGLPAPRQPPRRGSDTVRSPRSSRWSGLSFREAVNKPLAALSGARFSTSRVSAGASTKLKPPFISEDDSGDEDEHSPLLGNPWRESETPPDHGHRPHLGPHTISSDSIMSVVASTAATSLEGEQQVPDISPPGTPSQTQSSQMTPTIPTITGTTPPRITTTVASANNNTATPTAPRSSLHHHYNTPVISPSPFSSTLTAVVADKLLAHLDGSGTVSHSPSTTTGLGGAPQGGVSTKRTQRSGLRSSLFAPPYQDDNPPDEGDRQSQDPNQPRRERGASGSALDVGKGPLGSSGSNSTNSGRGVSGGTSGFRGRARSLSHTLSMGLGGLFGNSRKGAGGRDDAADNPPDAARGQDSERILASDPSLPKMRTVIGNGSTETV